MEAYQSVTLRWPDPVRHDATSDVPTSLSTHSSERPTESLGVAEPPEEDSSPGTMAGETEPVRRAGSRKRRVK